MNPGKLRHRVDVYGRVKSKNNAGATVYKPDKIKTIWAEIVPQTGSLQKQQAETVLSNVTHKIICRYEAGKDITQNMHLMFKVHRFDIKYILNPYFKNESLELFCEEVIE